jgi:uroporphyrinogen-III decarboxylase
LRFSREAYLELMTFGDADRPMFSELFGPLVGLPEEWRAQGASQDEIDLVAFDWDYVSYIDCGGNCGAFGTAPGEIREETDEYVIERDYLGRTTKLFKSAATLPLPLDFPVEEMDDWLKLKHHFQFTEERIDWQCVENARCAQKQGVLVKADIPGGWDVARELMGTEQACLTYYRQPELMGDILDTVTETCVKVLERISKKLVIDQLSVHEDMAGKSGPLIGPDQVHEFIKPYYRACWDLLSTRGTRLFNQDSDGNMSPLIDVFLDCGVNVMHPCEPAAGMDIVAIRREYGSRLAVLGGIDKHVLRQSKADIANELEYKMQPLMRSGGMVFGLDHRITNGTPLENYRYYVKLGREILGLPAPRPGDKGWGRMSF